MADLNPLIRLHKYKLDEMQRALAALNAQVMALERQKADLLVQIMREQEACEKNDEIGIAYGSFAQAAIERRRRLEESIDQVEAQILESRDKIKDAYAELKKFEMTQDARDQAEKDQVAYKQGQELDEIGLETHRRREKE